MTARILHISDFHLGRREELEPRPALRELAAELAPELVVSTGDLAHRGRRAQLRQASDFLESLGVPFLAVPGNHDIPYTFPARFTRPFVEWERIFGSTGPVYSADALVVVGLNSVRPFRHQGGALARSELARAASALESAPEGALRVVALHHHLAAPPWRPSRKRPISRRDEVLRSLAGAGAELVVSGHVHQAAIAERREFEAAETARPGSVVLASVPGFGRPRPHRRGEALGFNVYDAEAERLVVTTWAWQGGAFAEVGRRTFARR